MACRMASLLLLALLVGASGTVDADKQRPVSKVITLLKDMVAELQAEGEKDQEVKDEMDCWCASGLRDKTASIGAAQDLTGHLSAEIQDYSTRSAKLSIEIENLNKEVAHNAAALEESTQMRQKQLAEFSEDEKSQVTSIAQMKGAIRAIAAKHEGSFLQQKLDQDTNFLNAIQAVQTLIRQHAKLVTSHQSDVVAAFVQNVQKPVVAEAWNQLGGELKSFRRTAHVALADLSKSPGALLQQSYSPEHSSSSGEIFGVLKGMKESFENDLAGSQADENRQQADYIALKSAKEAQIAAAKSLAETKTTERGNIDQRHAESKQNLKDTEVTLAADQEYLGKLKEQCANIDTEFFQRTQLRQQETTAVSKALAFLNSDDANDLYARTFKSAAFFQTHMHSARRTKGALILAAAARRTHDSRLTELAVKIMNAAPAIKVGTQSVEENDDYAGKAKAFEIIESSVTDMADKLKTEKEDEIKHKDFCIDNIHLNERDTDTNNNRMADLEVEVRELGSYIAELAEGIKQLQDEIAISHVSVKRAGEDRDKSSTQFQMTVADQKATKKLLEGALKILKGFYEKAALIQTSVHSSKAEQPAGAPPPPGFKKQEKSGTSGGVMGMMEQIIKDAGAMIAEAVKDQEDVETGYETFVKETNKAIVAMQSQMANKMEDKALAESDKTQKSIELRNVKTESGELRQANIDLHSGCDYTLKNFDTKQAARDDEIFALKNSVKIMRGTFMSA